MNSVFIFVKKSDITTAMLNRSTSCCIDEVPQYVISKPWWYFGLTDTMAVLEIPSESLKITTIYDNYQWYNYENALAKIEEFNQSQL